MKLNMQTLEEMKIQPVGSGVIDLICAPERVGEFVDLCNREGLRIRGFTWWCHVTGQHEPCGMGGPRAKYCDGWYSEIPMDEIISLGDNESYRTYFSGIWQSDEGYRECYWPGFWLEE